MRLTAPAASAAFPADTGEDTGCDVTAVAPQLLAAVCLLAAGPRSVVANTEMLCASAPADVLELLLTHTDIASG